MGILVPQDPIASQAEAEAGIGTAPRRFSPQRISQAITALGGGGGSAVVQKRQRFVAAGGSPETFILSFDPIGDVVVYYDGALLDPEDVIVDGKVVQINTGGTEIIVVVYLAAFTGFSLLAGSSGSLSVPGSDSERADPFYHYNNQLASFTVQDPCFVVLNVGTTISSGFCGIIDGGGSVYLPDAVGIGSNNKQIFALKPSGPTTYYIMGKRDSGSSSYNGSLTGAGTWAIYFPDLNEPGIPLVFPGVEVNDVLWPGSVNNEIGRFGLGQGGLLIQLDQDIAPTPDQDNQQPEIMVANAEQAFQNFFGPGVSGIGLFALASLNPEFTNLLWQIVTNYTDGVGTYYEPTLSGIGTYKFYPTP